MYFLVSLINLAFDLYIAIILIQIAVSWLVAFDVMNADNPKAQNLMRLLHKATDPLYEPIRKYIPPIGGFDITPVIILVGLQILRGMIISLLL